jgi:Ribosomal proteins 50S-L18Ae/60S-L20/60S-L18A
MYKEFRELSRADAVKSLYQDMAARHRARFRSIHVRGIGWGSNSIVLMISSLIGYSRNRD